MFKCKFNPLFFLLLVSLLMVFPKVEAAPQAPQVSSPSGMVTGAVNFQWFEVTGATWYRISVWNDNNNNLLRKWVKAIDTCDNGLCQYQDSGFQLSGFTKWRMKAFDGVEQSLWSETLTMWDGITAPIAPELYAPNNSSPLPEGAISFDWEDLDDATWYKVQVQQTDPVNGMPIDNWLKVDRDVTCSTGDTGLSSCVYMSNYIPPDIGFGYAFIWRIRAYNGAMLGPWSVWEDVSNLQQ